MNIEELANGNPDFTSQKGWVRLDEGAVHTVYRNGDKVKRSLGPWSPAVHQLLRYLKIQEFSSVPELLEVTDEEEILSFLDGELIYDTWTESLKTNQWMVELGTWLRYYHEIAQKFELQDGISFMWGPEKSKQAMVVCHCDLGPWNCIQKEGKLVGVIDWDLARFCSPLDALAELAHKWIPLRHSTKTTMGFEPNIKRLETLCNSYGNYTPKEVLQHLPIYLKMISKDIQNSSNLEIQQFASFIERGFVESYEKDCCYIENYWLSNS